MDPAIHGWLVNAGPFGGVMRAATAAEAELGRASETDDNPLGEFLLDGLRVFVMGVV